jgi:MFS family permease
MRAARDDGDASGPREVLRLRAFALYWSGSTVGAFGGAITGVAIQVIVVTVLDASPFEIGMLNAIHVVPYLFLGLIVGALMDRRRRKPVLVATGIGRAIVLTSIPVLWVVGALQIWSFAILLLLFGTLSLFGDSAAQSFLPRIVPRRHLVSANARLGQSGTVAGTAGPALGGAILNWLGAPVAVAIDAVLHVVTAVTYGAIAVDEPRPRPRDPGRHIGHEILEGMRFTYRHRTLTPLAISVHFWFLGNSIAVMTFAPFALRDLGMDPLAYGIALAFAGVGGFLGAILAPRAGARLGAGGAVMLGRGLVVLPWVVLAVAPTVGAAGVVLSLAVVCAAQFVYGFAMGIEDANDMGYRQAVAPDEMQGRMNATIRTVNRVTLLVGSLLGGLLATALGYRVSMVIGAAVFVVATLVLAFSPARSARHEDASDHQA